MSHDRKGYTLLELILALSLSLVVVLGIAQATRLYLVALPRQQALIERKQIARGVGEMIGNDLRAAIQYKAQDYSGLETLVRTQLLLQQAASEKKPGPRDSVIDESNVAFRPTLLGDENHLLVDVSRLPRMDQYNPMIASKFDRVQTPSDIKSIAYFVSQQSTKNSSPSPGNSNQGGLYRRSIDRAVANYRGDTGLIGAPDQFSQLIASEIIDLKFSYFDGESWTQSWNSQKQSGFPTAIEIKISINPSGLSNPDDGATETSRSVVHLPISEPKAENEGE